MPPSGLRVAARAVCVPRVWVALCVWLVGRGALGAALHNSDTCIWRSSISSTLPPVQEHHPRPDCYHGYIYWYYPKGQLQVSFRHERQGADFVLCLDGSSFDGMRAVYVGAGPAEDGGRELSNTGLEVCHASTEGSLLLTFEPHEPNPSRILTVKYHRQNPP